jgi:CTP:molybdopterin cytidylyltransferase MocA
VPEARSITPIILAAGASSRMGRTKALLEFDGRTCLELTLEATRGLGTPVVVLGPSREEIQARVRLGSVQIAINEEVERGQTASLKAGLECLSPAAEAFLFYPVDFPLVGAEEVERLVGAFLGSRDQNKSVFIPSYSMQRGHPVLCRSDLAAEFLALPDGAPARTVINFRPQRISYVDFEQAYILMDMDTPEDYEKCLESYRARERMKNR